VSELHPAKQVRVRTRQLHWPAAEEVTTFPSHGQQRDLLRGVVDQVVVRGSEQVGVEGPAKATIGRDEHQQHLLHGALNQQRVSGASNRFRARGRARKHRQHLLGKRPHVEHVFLRPTQPSRRHHLHGAGNLLYVLHGADSGPNVTDVGHALSPQSQSA